jgi:hypothetical protein
VILKIGHIDLGLGAPDASPHRNSGIVHRVRIAGHQRMPPVKVAPLRDELVATTGRQPVQGPDILGVSRTQSATLAERLG